MSRTAEDWTGALLGNGVDLVVLVVVVVVVVVSTDFDVWASFEPAASSTDSKPKLLRGPGRGDWTS